MRRGGGGVGEASVGKMSYGIGEGLRAVLGVGNGFVFRLGELGRMEE